MVPGIRVLMLTSEWPTPDRPLTVPFVVRQAEFARRAGIDVDVFHFQGKKKVLSYLRAWKQVRGLLRSEHYNLVHCQFGQSALLPWPKRVPVVVTFRGCDLLGVKDAAGRTTLPGRLLRALCRLVATRANAVIVVSEHMRAQLPPHLAVHVIPSGLDFNALPCLPQTEARQRLGLPQGERLVLFVGDPNDPRKRYGLANCAVEILNESLEARLVLGWGVPHAQVPLYMNACDAFVFTSSQEGSPNVVKEALACNLPIAAVPVADVPRRLQGVQGCEVCRDDRPKTIAEALERLLRRGQRSNGREAVKELDEELLTNKVIGIYRSVLAGETPELVCV